jgi:hypothetical protein
MAWGGQTWGDCITWGGGTRYLASDLVASNFAHRLEAIAPTCELVGRPFRRVDRIKLGGDAEARQSFGNSSGRCRDFVIQRRESAEDVDASCAMLREAWHTQRFAVAYPTCIGTEHELHELMDIDRNDVVEALRHRSSFRGTVANSCAFTGLQVRRRESDFLDDSEDVWLQVYQYRCLVREDPMAIAGA